MDDEPSAVAGANGLDDVVDDLALEFGGVEQRVAPVGAQQIGKYARAHQVDFFGVDLVAYLPPLLRAELGLPLEALFEVENSEVNVDAPLRESLAKRRDDLALAAALAGDVLGQPPQVLG
jgi:hypothetical protein